MNERLAPLDLSRVKTLPLAQRHSLSALQDILVDPAQPPRPCSALAQSAIQECARTVIEARRRGASVMLLYGAHLVKNGAMAIVNRLLQEGWLTHLATNGAGTIHDWELAYFGRTEESVRQNVPTGTFGTWEETGRNLHLALLAGALEHQGYGASLGRFILENGVTLPTLEALAALVRAEPLDPRTPARAELLQAMVHHGVASGRIQVNHQHPESSILAQAFRHQVPLSVHPGIGYNIISTHPLFNGAAIGRAGGVDFAHFCRAVDGLDGGVVLSVGSAIMAPQVFEKSLSVVNNLRLQAGRPIVADHSFYVVDLQPGGQWDWKKGEPPKDNPAYYLRFCKSFARMGGNMQYVQCDNVAFLQGVLHGLAAH